MGILSSFRAAAAKSYGALRIIAREVASAGKAVNATGSKVLGKFTGKEKYDEAQSRYDSLLTRCKLAEEEHRRELDTIFGEIALLLPDINNRKAELYSRQFVRFGRMAENFAHWEIPHILAADSWYSTGCSSSILRTWHDLKLIDFDNAKFKAYAMSILTAGFWTRKKARETLFKVKEEEAKLEHELVRLETERTRLRKVLKSLRQVAFYFQTLTLFYDYVLDDLEYAIVLLCSAHEIKGNGMRRGKLDAYYLPKNHLLCFIAADKLTRILHDFSGRQFLQGQESGIAVEIEEDFLALAQAMSEAQSIEQQIKLAA